jgi:isoprenylcysteine carboxyl methyltransferase (ICMT) family protein YpbQ
MHCLCAQMRNKCIGHTIIKENNSLQHVYAGLGLDLLVLTYVLRYYIIMKLDKTFFEGARRYLQNNAVLILSLHLHYYIMPFAIKSSGFNI